MGDRESASRQIGVKRLHIAQRGFAGGRIAHMPGRDRAGQAADDIFTVKIAGDMAHCAVRVEFAAVKAGYPGRFLTAVLQCVKAQRNHRGSAFGIVNAKDTAFLAQLVVIEGIGGEHVQSESRLLKFALHIGMQGRNVSPLVTHTIPKSACYDRLPAPLASARQRSWQTIAKPGLRSIRNLMRMD